MTTETATKTSTFNSRHGQLTYFEQGRGPTVVAIHGTPTSSLIYRPLLRGLTDEFRVLTPDLLGFGESAKPKQWDGSPREHSQILRAWLDDVEAERFHLILHDFGGPIGLGAVAKCPERVLSISIFNSWAWSTEGTQAQQIGRLMKTRLGRWLYLDQAVSPKVLLPTLFYNKSVLTPELKLALQAPFAERDSRWATWEFARALYESNDFFKEVEDSLSAYKETPSLILWGARDPAFSATQLQIWQRHLPLAKTVILQKSGHFPMLEQPVECEAELGRFLKSLV